MEHPTVIHWFLRDLRLCDNRSLAAAAATGLPVVPVYVLSGWKGGHAWTGPNRQAFCVDVWHHWREIWNRLGAG